MKVVLKKPVTGKEIEKLKGATGDFWVTIPSFVKRGKTRKVGIMGVLPDWLLAKALEVSPREPFSLR